MKKIYFIFTLFISTSIFSQITFEKGFFINNANQKVECLIKNADWRKNPTTFTYKLTENSALLTQSIKNVKEFTIYNQSTYVRKTVGIDQSSQNLSKLDTSYEPKFENQEVFLKLIISGAGTLYLYDQGGQEKLFLQIKDAEPYQLIYKKYTIDLNAVGYNNSFRKQLKDALQCANINSQNFDNIQYNLRSLIKVVSNYNKCTDPNFEIKNINHQRSIFKLSVRPRINFSSATLEDQVIKHNFDFEKKTNFSIGLEAEYILGFHKNKWAFIVEPTFQTYQGETVNNIEAGNRKQPVIEYQSIEVPLGVRHYMFLSNTSKLFLNAQYIADFQLKNVVSYPSESTKDNYLYGKSFSNFAFGFGYKFKDKYGAEFRYFTGRNLSGNYSAVRTIHQNTSLIISYNLL